MALPEAAGLLLVEVRVDVDVDDRRLRLLCAGLCLWYGVPYRWRLAFETAAPMQLLLSLGPVPESPPAQAELKLLAAHFVRYDFYVQDLIVRQQ